MLLTEAPPLAVQEAQRRILARTRILLPERVPLAAARGGVLAAPVTARADLPPWDNSAMDGYAVRAADVAAGVSLPVALDLPAGSPSGQHLPDGAAARIMTGAPLPVGADAVVPVEATEGPGGEAVFARPGEQVRFAAPVAPGDHVRRRGEDVRAGEICVPAGAVLGPAQIAMAASAGHAALDVVRRPDVAILSTGDELVDVGEADHPDAIVNGNAYGIAAQVEEAGGVARRLPIAPDEPAAIGSAIRDALTSDAVVTIGGVSVGERDHVRAALADAGVELAFWRVAIRPGGPMAFGVSEDGRPVFALPGNPVSAQVTFELFARPALRRMAGHARCFRAPLTVTLAEGVKGHPEKALYLRARLARDGDGWRATWTGAQGSAVLSGLAAADALVVIPAGAGTVAAGKPAAALPLRADLFDREEP